MLTNQLTDRAWRAARGAARTLEGAGRFAVDRASGQLHRVRGGGPKPGMDDRTLTRKVETILFRERDAPKGQVDIYVVDGIVELRGEMRTAAQIRDLEARTRAIPEVIDVTNLLQQPKTPRRTRADAPGRAKRTAGQSPARSAQRAKARTAPRTGRTRVTAEEPAAAAEPGPAQHAAEGTGRAPAPMGSHDTGADTAGTPEAETPAQRFAREIENDPASNPPPDLDRLRGG